MRKKKRDKLQKILESLGIDYRAHHLNECYLREKQYWLYMLSLGNTHS